MKLILSLLFFSISAMALETRTVGGVTLQAESIRVPRDSSSLHLRKNSQATARDFKLSCQNMIVQMRPENAKAIMAISGIDNCKLKIGKKLLSDKGFLIKSVRRSGKWIIYNSSGKEVLR